LGGIISGITIACVAAFYARVNFLACQTGLRPRKLACLGVGVDFGGITRPRPPNRLASHFVGLASQFVALIPAKFSTWLVHFMSLPNAFLLFCVLDAHFITSLLACT
jgi:hypothetical protein